MKITIEEKVMNYLHEHHKQVITLNLEHSGYSGYDAHLKHPHVRFHQPRHTENFNQYQVDDITVYVEKDIPTIEDQLIFQDETLLGHHSCHVKGIDLEKLEEVYMHH